MKAYLTNTIENKTLLVTVPGSKSESNRLSILKNIYPNISLKNLSNCDDTLALSRGIDAKNGIIDVHHAGTAMRFLTSFFASKKDIELTLTGSKRMQERPIKILVDTLRVIGADISYIKNNGYPPLKINGKELVLDSLSIDANISSQYISALMLIAPSLHKGLTITLKNKITSVPYIKMTLELLNEIGICCTLNNNIIKILVANKIDSITPDKLADLQAAASIVCIAAKNKLAIDTLKTALVQKAVGGDVQTESTVVTNARHQDALLKLQASLQDVSAGLSAKITGDLLALDIRQCLHYLGLITGEITNDDQLDYIFSKFCIGK